MRLRVFINTDGSLRIVSPNRGIGISEESAFVHAVRADPTLAGLPFVDLDADKLPPDKAKRHAWRLNPARDRIIVDPTVPDLPKNVKIRKLIQLIVDELNVVRGIHSNPPSNLSPLILQQVLDRIEE